MINSSFNTRKIIDCAMAKNDASLIIKNGKLINVYTCEILDSDIVICDDVIVYLGKNSHEFQGKDTLTIDAKGNYVSPGLIESHIHVESSMLSITEFTKAIIPHGTTTVVVDPHELANVSGIEGINVFIQEAKEAPIRYLIEAPSCVPSLPGMETSGATIDAEKIDQLLKRKEIFALAEMMNYPGVFLGDSQVMQKLNSAKKYNKLIEGHAPLLTGKELNAYIAAGVSSDHECSSFEEVIEKLRLGMKIQVREGSHARDLENIFTKLKKKDIDFRNILIASDDRTPSDLKHKGHLDYSLKKLVKLGINPVLAIQMVTINTATHLKMADKIGGIAPGKKADITIFEDLKDFNVLTTIASGKIIYNNHKLQYKTKKVALPQSVLNTTKNLEIPNVNDLKLAIDGEKKQKVTVHVIGVKEHSLVTEKRVAELSVKQGFIQPDLKNDILPICVLNRHTSEKSIGKSFIQGLGIKDGALASTIAHDSHQLIVTGTSYEYILKAIETIKKIRGGQVLITKDEITTVPLGFSGIMSTKKLEQVIKEQQTLQHAIQKLNLSINEPFMALAFVALPVIPHLKLTDKGLVDVDSFEIISPIRTKGDR